MNLILSAKNGDLNSLRSQIDSGKCINQTNPHGWTPLHMSVYYNRFECFTYILSLEETRLEAKTHAGETALFMACYNRKTPFKYVQCLIEAGANVNAEQNESKTPLYQIADNEIIKMTTDELNDNMKKAYLLIEAGASLDAYEDLGDDTPLFAAIQQDNHELVEMLLYAGADANYKRNFDGCTALMLASQRASIEIVTMLLPFIDDINATDYDGRTALMSAQGNVTKLLLNVGANPNLIADDIPITALHLAIGARDITKCKLLFPHVTRNVINKTREQSLLYFTRSRLTKVYDNNFIIQCFKRILVTDIDEDFFFTSYFERNEAYPPIGVLIFESINSFDSYLWNEYIKLIYIFLSKGAHLNPLGVERSLYYLFIQEFYSWSHNLEQLIDILVDHGLKIEVPTTSFNTCNKDNAHMPMLFAQYLINFDELEFHRHGSTWRIFDACSSTFALDNLKHQCRRVIRKSIWENSQCSRLFFQHIKSLTLPETMRNYLRYKFT